MKLQISNISSLITKLIVLLTKFNRLKKGFKEAILSEMDKFKVKKRWRSRTCKELLKKNTTFINIVISINK
jgi:hypothetical protein